MSGKVGDNPYRASGVVAPVASDAYNDDQIQSNIAILGFYVAVNGSLVKYNLVDQTIDEYFDTSGVDASASTNEARSGVSPYYYYGVTSSTPSVTEDADETGTDGDYSWYKWTDTAVNLLKTTIPEPPAPEVPPYLPPPPPPVFAVPSIPVAPF